MRLLLVLMLLLVSPMGRAVRTLPSPTFATLVQPVIAQQDGRPCAVPAGSTVQLMSRLTDVGRPQAPARFFLRVVGGPCDGYGLTLDASGLREPRAAPAAPDR